MVVNSTVARSELLHIEVPFPGCTPKITSCDYLCPNGCGSGSCIAQDICVCPWEQGIYGSFFLLQPPCNESRKSLSR